MSNYSRECKDKYFFKTILFSFTAHRSLVFYTLFIQYSQRDLPPLRLPCKEAPGRDSNLRRVDL